MKLAFLFAGQGAQSVGMGLDVYQNSMAAQTFLDSIQCSFDLKTLIFEGPAEKLNQTEYTQVAVLVTSLMIAQALKAEGIEANAVAGLSLGEYSALTYAHVFKLDDVIDLVQARGLLMAKALPSGYSGMFALISSDIASIQSVLLDPSVSSLGIVDVANYNSPNQTVISGELTALNQAVSLLKSKGIRCIPLKVSGAFHSRLLRDSSVELQGYLDQVNISKANKEVYFNIDGQKHDEITPALVQQIYSSVQWVNTIETMIKDGVTHFVEIGPGKTLSKFVQAIDASVICVSVETIEEIKTLKGVLYG